MLALGEMGRKPKCGTQKNAGRDHWDYAQFVLAAGGGFKGGSIVGATDKLGEQVTDKFYKVESFGRTLYHLLGIDPDTIVTTPQRPAGQADRRGRAADQGGDRLTRFLRGARGSRASMIVRSCAAISNACLIRSSSLAPRAI